MNAVGPMLRGVLSGSTSCYDYVKIYQADYRLVPSEWETALQSNAVSHWLGANLESALHYRLVIFVSARQSASRWEARQLAGLVCLYTYTRAQDYYYLYTIRTKEMDDSWLQYVIGIFVANILEEIYCLWNYVFCSRCMLSFGVISNIWIFFIYSNEQSTIRKLYYFVTFEIRYSCIIQTC